MRRLIPLLFLAVLLQGRPAPSSAQVTRADTAAVLLAAARDFQSGGRWEVAEALFQYVAERFRDTPAEADALEALHALRASSAVATSPGSRVELQVWSTFYGLWLGVALPAALGADRPEPYGLGLLLGGPGGFFAGRSLAKSRSLSEGQVRAVTFGGTWGTWQGAGWAEVLDIGDKEVCNGDVCHVQDAGTRTLFTSLVAGGLAGIATGAVLARKPISPGTATTVNFGALWGTWFGIAGSVLADLEEDDFLAATLVGGNAGLLATALLAPNWNLSRDRARLISIAGVMGGLAGGGLDLIIQPDDKKVAMGIPLATSIAGLALGATMTRDHRSAAGPAGVGRHGAAGKEPATSAFTDGALFHYAMGRLALGVPAPFPTLVAVDGPRGSRWKPGWGLTLFQAAL
jgi:hypothetical protein